MQEGHPRQISRLSAPNGRVTPPGWRLRFASFTFEVDNRQLLGPDGAISLAPKPLALLEYLLTHPQRVASKDAILEEVWGSIVVTDDSIVQAVRELREALGDTNKEIVKTVHRRGYMLATPVVEETAPDPLAGDSPIRGDTTRSASAAIDAMSVDPIPPVSSVPIRTRQQLLVLLVTLLGVVAIVIWLAMVQAQAPRIDEGIAERRALSVLPFDDTTAGDDKTLGARMASQIEARVMLRQGMRVVTQSGAVLTNPAPASRARSSSSTLARKAQFVIHGRILQGGDRVNVEAILSSVSSGESYSIGRGSYPSRRELESSNFADQVSSALRARYDEIEAKRAADPAHQGDPVDLTLAAWREQNRSNSHDDLVKARAKFEEAFAMDPTSIMASQGVGASYLLQFMQTTSKSPAVDLDKAEETVRTALTLGPEVPQNLTMWGDVLMYRSQFKAAVDVLQKSIDINPDYTNGHLNLAEACILAGDIQNAQTHVDAAKRLTPKDTVRLQQFAYGC